MSQKADLTVQRAAIPWSDLALCITKEDVAAAIRSALGQEPDEDLVEQVADEIFPEIDLEAEVRTVLRDLGLLE